MRSSKITCIQSPMQVHIKSRFILNGVCAKWRGWLDLDRLDGVGCVEFDEEAARVSFVFAFLSYSYKFDVFALLGSRSIERFA